MNRPEVKGFYDARTGSIQYVVSDPATGKCAIIDPVLDFDEKSGTTATVNADAILDYIGERGLTVEWILDTHPHADHFSAGRYLKAKTGAPTAIGDHAEDVKGHLRLAGFRLRRFPVGPAVCRWRDVQDR